MRTFAAAVMLVLAAPAAALADGLLAWEPPSCAAMPTMTVTAGFSTVFGPCFGEHVELVSPPQHGQVSFVATGDEAWLPAYDADPDAGNTTDAFTVRAVTAAATSPDVRYEVTIKPAAVPAPAPAAQPAPVLGLRALSRRRRTVMRRGLPLALSTDVPCAMAVSVTWRGTVVGTATALAAGRLVVPIAAPARHARRLDVTVASTLAGHAPSAISRTVRLR